MFRISMWKAQMTAMMVALALAACTVAPISPTSSESDDEMATESEAGVAVGLTDISNGEQMTHSEGPAYDAATDTFVFSDVRGQTVRRYSEAGQPVTTFIYPTGGANGTAFDLEGNYITAEGSRGLGPAQVIKRDPETGEVIEVLADNYEGKKLNSPNDLVVANDGSIYFTDPRFGSQEGRELEFEAVYRIAPDGSVELVLGEGEVIKPNGVGLSPDQTALYVADSGDGQLKRWTRQADGSFGGMEVVFDFKAQYGDNARGIDGFAFDVKGNIYGAGGRPDVEGNEPGVYVISPEGELLAQLKISEHPATNTTFGGVDDKTLFITAGKFAFEIGSVQPGFIPGKEMQAAVDSPEYFAGELASEQITHSEGPSYNPATGALIFSDVRGQTLRSYTGVGQPVTTFYYPTGGSNGTAIDLDGNLITAEGSRGLGPAQIIKRDPETGEVIEVLADNYEGKKLNSPNDLVVASDGSIYFTDPRFGSQEGRELEFEAVYRIAPDGSVELVLGEGEVIKPNGIGLSPDESTLYVADSGVQQLKRWTRQADGSFGGMEVVFDFKAEYGDNARGIDGFAFDVKGNIYGAGGRPDVEGNEPGVYVISPEGELLAQVEIPEHPATNVVFGGEELTTLYLTAGKYVYEMQSAIPGYNPAIQ